MVPPMGDKSPKSKQRGEKQKNETGKKDAAKAKAKQDKSPGGLPAKGGKK